MKPKRKVSKRITELTNITQEMLDKNGQTLEPAVSEFVAFIGDHWSVSFNAEFDKAFLHSAAWHSGRTIANPCSCVADGAARLAWQAKLSPY